MKYEGHQIGKIFAVAHKTKPPWHIKAAYYGAGVKSFPKNTIS
jgi:hypothetical protein